MPQPFWKTDMKLIILDRDGVINQDRDDFVKSADEWVPLPGSMDAVAFLSEAGYTVAVATNQSGIGRGLFTMQELTEMHNKMHKMVQQAGGVIDKAENTYMVGDSLRDLQAVAGAGGKPVLVLTGKGKKTLAEHAAELPEGTQVFDDLMAFSQYLMRQDEAETEAGHAVVA